MPYQQLTTEERCDVYALRKAGFSLREIAGSLGRSPSTISRELRRNRGGRGYRPIQAQRLARERRHRARSGRMPKMSGSVCERVISLLREGWSPEQIAGRLAKDGTVSLSHETIYRFLKADKDVGGSLFRLLRHGHRKRKKRYGSHDRRGRIRDQVSIDERPAIVDRRGRIGDWEIDTIVGHQNTGYVVSIVERCSGFTVLGKVESKHAEGVTAKTLQLLEPLKAWVHTITADNGKEFADHASIAAGLQASIYFAHPYHSWERGCNENANGLVRQYLPKQRSFAGLTDQECEEIMGRLNRRPRKRLGWRTPTEVLTKRTGVALLN